MIAVRDMVNFVYRLIIAYRWLDLWEVFQRVKEILEKTSKENTIIFINT